MLTKHMIFLCDPGVQGLLAGQPRFYARAGSGVPGEEVPLAGFLIGERA
jgi:hypothetical protein